MNTRTVVIGIGIASGLVGLGFLAHYLYSGEQEEQVNDNPVNEAEKNETKQIETKLTVKTHKKRPQVKKIVMVKPKPQLYQPESKMKVVDVEEIKPPTADEFPLRLGSEGKRVVRLQVWLMRNYGWTGKVTGVFDEKTESLLKKSIKEIELDEATYSEMKMEKPVHEQIIKR